MYKIGDYTMHGNHGICKVVEIGVLEIDMSNKDRLYYTLSPVYSKGSMVYSPVDSTKVTMRDIIQVEEANELIENIATIPIIEEVNDKLLELRLKETMKDYTALSWLTIIKTLYFKTEQRSASGKRLSNSDERYLLLAKGLLYGELSIVLEKSKEEIEEVFVNSLSHV